MYIKQLLEFPLWEFCHVPFHTGIILFNVSDTVAKSYIDGKVRQNDYEGLARNFICLPHPGILMKRTIRNTWPERFEKEISVEARKEIEKIKKSQAVTCVIINYLGLPLSMSSAALRLTHPALQGFVWFRTASQSPVWKIFYDN